ncbi:hypothetical protein SLA2020_347960 [Shorea laevis]
MESYCGDTVLISGEAVLSKTQLDLMAINVRGPTEIMGAELLMVRADMDVNNPMECNTIPVETGGVSGNDGGDDLLNFEKDGGAISVRGILEGVVFENIEVNVEELAKESLGWRNVENLDRHEMGRSGAVSDSEGVGELPHFAKEKDGASDTEISKQKLKPSMKLRSSTKAPSRPGRFAKC